MVQKNKHIRPRNIIGCIVVITIFSGCQGRQLMLNEQKLNQGLVIVLPGIDGRAIYNENACKALCKNNFNMAVELYDWTALLGPIFNQCAIEYNRHVAAELAARIVKYHKENPGRPVFLIGHSGGTAIAIWAAEKLPESEKVDGIVLLASSLSPEYDLSNALRHTRAGIVSFYSDRDDVLLYIGTSLFGTMDGKHTEAAGMVGFRRPTHSSESYDRFFEVQWEPGMAGEDHDGGHFGCMAEKFFQDHISQLIASNSWNDYLAPKLAIRHSDGLAPTATVLAVNK
jgi:pimeloyl-ACP methyl ester carboxylesterase